MRGSDALVSCCDSSSAASVAFRKPKMTTYREESKSYIDDCSCKMSDMVIRMLQQSVSPELYDVAAQGCRYTNYLARFDSDSRSN